MVRWIQLLKDFIKEAGKVRLELIQLLKHVLLLPSKAYHQEKSLRGQMP